MINVDNLDQNIFNMEESKLTNEVVYIDEAMNITAGTRKYQKIMIMIFMIGPFTITSISVFNTYLVSEALLSPEFTKSGLDDLDLLWEGRESTFFIDVILAGVILGSLFIPHLADLYGRKKIIMNFCILNAFSLMLAGLSVNMLMLLIAGFILGFSFVGVYIVGIVLCVESLDFKQRAWYLGFYFIANNILPILTILLSLLEINWRVVILMYSFLAFIKFLLLQNVVESPRFLLVNVRKIEECKKALNKISLMNGEGHFSYSLESENNRKIISPSFKDVYHSRMNILKLLSCSMIWLIMLLAYYISFFNIPKLQMHPEIDSISMNLSIIAAILAGVHLINNYGRKIILLYCFLIEGALFLCISLMSYTLPSHIALCKYALFILFLINFLVAALVLMVIAIFSAEQFPTYIRCTCLGIVMLIGRFGSVIAAHIDYSGGDNIPFISIAIGILILCISPIVCLLEETHNKELDEMVENKRGTPLLDKLGARQLNFNR